MVNFFCIFLKKYLDMSFFCCIFVVRKEIRVMTKEEIINGIKNVGTTTARNSMGCSENWYNYFYAIKMTFSMEEIESMSEKELNNLIKLADNIEENLY